MESTARITASLARPVTACTLVLSLTACVRPRTLLVLRLENGLNYASIIMQAIRYVGSGRFLTGS